MAWDFIQTEWVWYSGIRVREQSENCCVLLWFLRQQLCRKITVCVTLIQSNMNNRVMNVSSHHFSFPFSSRTFACYLCRLSFSLDGLLFCIPFFVIFLHFTSFLSMSFPCPVPHLSCPVLSCPTITFPSLFFFASHPFPYLSFLVFQIRYSMMLKSFWIL